MDLNICHCLLLALKENHEQVGNKFLLQRRSVRVTEAFIDESGEDRLASALTEWHKTVDGPVATSCLELRVAEQRLVHCLSW